MKREDLYDSINSALLFALSNLHTTVVCKVMAVNDKTIDCKPVVNRVVNGESRELPTFTKVPPVFMSGGASYETWPISVGDYCLLFVTERCYDAWYFGSDFASPIEMRMHDYSDGFALVGIQNDQGAHSIPDVITRMGDMFASGNWEHEGDLNRTGNETVTGNREQTGTHKTIGSIESTDRVFAPILQGVLQGIGGGSAISDTDFTATELHAQNGWSGSFATGDSRTVTVVDGIITGVA